MEKGKGKMLGVAQIGVGYWGPNLLRNLVASKRCKVRAVADLAAQRRDSVQGLYPGVSVTDNVDEILRDKDIAAVVIATPVSTHFDLAVRALEAGKHILVEKPIATTVAEVDEIGRIARKNKLVAMAGHTFLYNAAVRYAKKLIDSGELGDIRYIYSQRLNLGRIRSDVDALWNFAPHDISIIQYWLGDPEPISIMKRGVDYIQEKIDDVAFINIVYPGKIMANIHVSWLDPRRLRQMTVVGSRKMIVYDNDAESKIAIYDKGIDRKAILGQHMDYDTPRTQSFNYREGDIILPRIDFPEPIKVEIDHFIDCIENGTACLSGIDHARNVVRILAAP
jgi:predicted dehydrogenase